MEKKIEINIGDYELGFRNEKNIFAVIVHLIFKDIVIIKRDLEEMITEESFYDILDFFELDANDYWDDYTIKYSEHEISKNFTNISFNDELICWCIEMVKED